MEAKKVTLFLFVLLMVVVAFSGFLVFDGLNGMPVLNKNTVGVHTTLNIVNPNDMTGAVTTTLNIINPNDRGVSEWKKKN